MSIRETLQWTPEPYKVTPRSIIAIQGAIESDGELVPFRNFTCLLALVEVDLTQSQNIGNMIRFAVGSKGAHPDGYTLEETSASPGNAPWLAVGTARKPACNRV